MGYIRHVIIILPYRLFCIIKLGAYLQDSKIAGISTTARQLSSFIQVRYIFASTEGVRKVWSIFPNRFFSLFKFLTPKFLTPTDIFPFFDFWFKIGRHPPTFFSFVRLFYDKRCGLIFLSNLSCRYLTSLKSNSYSIYFSIHASWI